MKISVPKDVGAGNVIHAGIYRFRATGTKVAKSQNSDNMLINVEFTCQSPTDSEGGKVMGRKLFETWTVAEQCLSIWNNGYKALTGHDIPMGDYEIDEFLNRITSDITNKECIIELGIEYQHKGTDGKWTSCAPDAEGVVPRNKVKKYLPLTGAASDAPQAPQQRVRK
jgi:hypothetical protein